MIRTWSLRSVFLGLMAIVTSGSLSYAADEKGWINLFNGKDLTGWIQKGGMAKYRIENDETWISHNLGPYSIPFPVSGR